MRGYSATAFVTMTLLGEAVLAQRFTGNLADDLLGVALALTAAIAGIKLLGRLPKNRTVRMVFTFGKIVAGVYTLWIFARWAADTLLDSASTVLPFITFGAVALALGLSGREKVIKAALVLAPITVVFLLLIFGFSLPFMEVKYLIPYKAPTLSGVGRAFLSSFLPLAGAILPIAESFSGKKGGGKGLALGSALLGLTFIDTLAVFGSEYAVTLTHPFALAVTTASVGELFSRCDPLLYAVGFFTCLIRAAACFGPSLGRRRVN